MADGVYIHQTRNHADGGRVVYSVHISWVLLYQFIQLVMTSSDHFILQQLFYSYSRKGSKPRCWYSVNLALDGKALAPEEGLLIGLSAQEVLQQISPIQGTTFRGPGYEWMETLITILWTWLQDEIPVIQSSWVIKDSLFCESEKNVDKIIFEELHWASEPCSKHILTVNFTPEVPIVLGIISNLEQVLNVNVLRISEQLTFPPGGRK